MLFHLQLPFTDLRSFVPGPAPRIPVPSWPAPIIAEEFVRSFGVVRQRLKGGLMGWIAESEYCEARRALMFPPSALGSLRSIPQSAAEIPLRVVFRRLYFDGYAVGKTEVGLRALGLPMTTLPLESVVARVLAVPATIRTVKGPREQCQLHEAGKPLARLYAYATSKVVHDPEEGDPASVILSEAPILFIEVAAHEANRVRMPRYARKVSLHQERGFDLFFWRAAVQGRMVSVWCLVLKGFSFDPEARSLRIYLLRLNAEHQAFKRVLKAVDTKQISPAPRGDTAQLLQDYFNIATRRIGKCESKAQTYSSELDKLAFSLFDIAAPGQRDSLRERLSVIEVRKNIFRKVDAYTTKQMINISMYGGKIDMSSGDTINVSGSTNVNIKSTLTDVQQTVSTMAVGNDAQKKDLQDLLNQLADLLQKVPPARAEEAEAVATQASQLVDAAAKDKPNRTMLQVIGNGLKQTADFVRDVAPSAVTVAGQIVSLIGKIHGVPL